MGNEFASPGMDPDLDEWAAVLESLERDTSVSVVRDFVSDRLVMYRGPSIDQMRGEEAADLVIWCYRSGSTALKRALRTGVAGLVKELLEQDVDRVRSNVDPIVDLLALVEDFGAVEAWVFLRTYCCDEDNRISERLRRLISVESSLGHSLPAQLIRAFGALQQHSDVASSPIFEELRKSDELKKLGKFWTNTLEDHDLPQLAIPAFFGLRRFASGDARIGLPFVASACGRLGDADSFAHCLLAYLDDAQFDGPPLSLHEGDWGLMFQSVPRETRSVFVDEVMEILFEQSVFTQQQIRTIRALALRSAPSIAFLEPLRSPLYAEIPAFNLQHWPQWAYGWTDQLKLIWLNLSQQVGTPGLDSGRIVSESVRRLIKPLRDRWADLKVVVCLDANTTAEEFAWLDTDHTMQAPVNLDEALLAIWHLVPDLAPGDRNVVLQTIQGANDSLLGNYGHTEDVVDLVRPLCERDGLPLSTIRRCGELAFLHDILDDPHFDFDPLALDVQGLLQWRFERSLAFFSLGAGNRSEADRNVRGQSSHFYTHYCNYQNQKKNGIARERKVLAISDHFSFLKRACERARYEKKAKAREPEEVLLPLCEMEIYDISLVEGVLELGGSI